MRFILRTEARPSSVTRPKSAPAPTVRRSRPCRGTPVADRPRLAVVLALALFLPAALWAQSREIRFDRISIEDGLSQDTVTCILQDRIGFMWLGTQDGLNHFDGTRFSPFKTDPRNPATLPNDFIKALLEDDAGDIWVGTNGGLSRWQVSSDTFIHYRHDPDDLTSLSGNAVQVLYKDRVGTFWVGMTHAGLSRFDPETGTFTHFRHDPSDRASLSDNQVRVVYEDTSGRLWVGTLGGLNLFDRERRRFTRWLHDPDDLGSLSNNQIRSILEDSTGALWVGTLGGLHRLDSTTMGFERFLHDPADPGSLSEDRVRVLYEDRDERLWVGTDGGLNLFQRPSETFIAYRHDPAKPTSLSADRIMAIYQDRGGVLWIGTQRGINKWNPMSWSFLHSTSQGSPSSELTSNDILAFSEDGEGGLWIGTSSHGLNRLDRETGTVQHFLHDPQDPESLSDNRVMALFHDRHGTLWVGTMAGGLNRFDRLPGRPETGSFERFLHDPGRADSLSAAGVSAFFEDRRGRLWVGTWGGGLNRFDRLPGRPETGGFVHFRHDPSDPESLSNDRVTCFAEELDSTLWVGTFEGGLNRFDPETQRFRRIERVPGQTSGLTSNMVFSLHVDASGTLWVGTQVGLHRFEGFDESDTAVFKVYLEEDGLSNDFVYAVESDTWGRLWMSTNKGLSRFDPKTGAFKNYDTSHGLQSDEFNMGAHFKSASGELFFGGIKGFNSFFPEDIEKNTSIPPVVLTSFSKLNQKVDFGKPIFEVEQIPLDYTDYFITFEFAALDYTSPEKNQYRYKLIDFDDDWIELGNRHLVTFTNLDPADYVLRVQASNNDGVWNEEGLSIAISIAPPYWKTWWFKVSGALAALAVVVLVYKIKTRSIRRNAERLQVQVKERTRELEEAQHLIVQQERLAVLGELAGGVAHELRNPLGVIKNSIYFLRMTLKEIGEKAKKHLDLIDQEIQRSDRIIVALLDYTQDDRSTSKIGRFRLEEVTKKVVAEIIPDTMRVDVQLDAGPLIVLADHYHVERILLNLLTNAVQAMPDGGDLRILCQRQGGEVIVEVTDTGVGISEETLRKVFDPLFTTKFQGIGLGLTLSQRYAETNGGRIECESVLGQGSTFRLVLPSGEGEGSATA